MRNQTLKITIVKFWFSIFNIEWKSNGRKPHGPYSREICLNMWHGNSENSDGCSYLLKICFIYGTNVTADVTVSQSWIPLQVVHREQCAFSSTKKRVQIKILSILTGFIWKFIRERLFWTTVRKRRLTAKENSIANCEQGHPTIVFCKISVCRG